MIVIRQLIQECRHLLVEKDLRSPRRHPAEKLVKLEYLLQLQALGVLFFQLRLVFLDLPD